MFQIKLKLTEDMLLGYKGNGQSFDAVFQLINHIIAEFLANYICVPVFKFELCRN